MEVFCRNVPQELTDVAFEGEIKPLLEGLGIINFSCEKPRRRPHAWITFLSVDDAAKFLERYGSVTGLPKSFRPHRKSVQTSRLTIANTPILVQQSNRSVQGLAMKHLEHQREERESKSIQDTHQYDLRDNNIKISDHVSSIRCGNNIFTGQAQSLTFLRQLSVSIEGLVTFYRQFLLVTFESAAIKVRILVPYDIVQDLVADDGSARVTMVLTEPPRFFSFDRTTELFNPSPSQRPPVWQRVSSCPLWPSHERFVARCLVYQLKVFNANHLIQQLRQHDTISVTRYHILTRSAYEDENDTTAVSRFWEKLIGMNSVNAPVRFTILFMVQALVFNNYLNPTSGTTMLKHIEKMAKDCHERNKPFPFSDRAMKVLFKEIPYPCPGTEPSELDVVELLEKVKTAEEKLQLDDPSRFGEFGADLPDSQVWVMKALVTPTRVLLTGPEAESKNRILRKYQKHTDYFLRIQFCEENGQDLAYNPRISNDAIYQRFRVILRQGIRIATRQFTFLGFSHSSLRSHSTWFVAPFNNKGMMQDYESIVTSLGSFEDIRIPAKCAARIGQAFSETPYSVPFRETGMKYCYIRDIKNHDGSRVFSDGIGKLSYDAMVEFWSYLPPRANAPTCFQIRCGGAKGMLTLDPTLEGKVIHVREESMVKFPSKDIAEVGICEFASRPFRMVLNRQLIKIMEDMGVSPQWFLSLQNKELRRLRSVTTSARSASTFLRQQLLGVKIGLPTFIKRLGEIGLDYRSDLFLRSIVEHAVLEQLRLLKYKARVPVEQGVTLFGVVDETKTLGVDEVYVTFDNGDDQIAKPPPRAKVLITRSPALHPGDVRVVTMVQPPPGSPLLQLRNCVVFNCKGDRDLPSMLSGGDLDGDLYSVIWDPNASAKVQYTPADYPRVTPEQLDRDVTKDDIADFFINFMKTDVLGVIATRHMMLSDLYDEGVSHADCLTLAGLHSTAVDSSKSGIAVDMKLIPSAPRYRPDFLSPAPPLELYARGEVEGISKRDENDNDDDNGDDGFAMAPLRFYKSEKILGKLYRNVNENLIWENDIKARGKLEHPQGIWRLLLNHALGYFKTNGITVEYRPWVNEALKLRNWYETAMADFMWQFSDNPRRPLTEVEVFCGSVLNKRGSQTRRQRDSSIKMKEEVDRLMSWIAKLIQHRDSGAAKAAAAAPPEDEDEGAEQPGQALALSLACFIVGLGKSQGEENLQSFKIVAACCLLQQIEFLKQGGGGAGQNPDDDLSSILRSLSALGH